MTNIPLLLREKCNNLFKFGILKIELEQISKKKDTVKRLYKLEDNQFSRKVVLTEFLVFGKKLKPGDTINKGDVVCTIEAMKLFNEIESEVSGKIAKVLVENAAPVEYDQPLFLIITN